MVIVKSIGLLTSANLRKNKSQAITLLLIMIFVAMFVNISVVMSSGIGNFLDRRAEELNVAHFVSMISNYEVGDIQIDFIQQHPYVAVTEFADMVIGNGEVIVEGVADTNQLMFSRAVSTQEMNPPIPIGEYLPLTGDAIYLPHFMMISGNHALGDTIRFNFLETELTFTVAGSVEEFFFGSMMTGLVRFYVSDEALANLQDQFPDNSFRFMFAQMHDIDNAGAFATAYLEMMTSQVGGPDFQWVTAMNAHYNMIRGSHTFFPNIIGMILATFAATLLIVSLIIIRFRINNSIDESMVNIGTLKAIGYSNRQIIASILMQFSSIALVGGVIGIVLSQILLPLVTGIMGPFFPFPFVPGFDFVTKLVLIAIIMVSVLFFSFLATRRIYKLFPLVALRGGLKTHSFKRNRLPLEKFGGPLSWLLAMKDIMQNKRQAIAIAIVITVISMIAAEGIAIHYAINVNNEEFTNAIVGEMFDVVINPAGFEEIDAFIDRLNTRPEVIGITEMLNGIRLNVDREMVFTTIAEDYSMMGQSVVRGRLPIHDNEIALGNGVLRAIGKDIGDWVTIQSGGYDYQFLITGLVQASANGGMMANMTRAGFTRMQPMDEFGLALFLADGICPSEFAEVLRAEESEHIMNLMVFQEIIDAQLEEMGGIFFAVAMVIQVVTAIIVVATMYLVIKTTVLRKRRELGIQKALGFTTFQLMNQIALNLTPAIIIGSIAGAVIAYLTVSDLFVLSMRASGIVQANLPVPIGWIGIMCVAIIVLAYVVSMLVAWRIRKISAYALVSE